jgi:transposase
MSTPARSRRDFAALEARRFQAARLFARGTSQGAVARALGVTPVTAHHWYHAWHANGRAALKSAGRAGRKPKLEAKQLATIEQALRAGPRLYGFSTDLWTLPRVAAVIERLTRVRHHPGHVWRILRGLNWSLQRPARRAREREDAALGAAKKTPGASTPGSSSKTKAASRSSRSSAARGPRAAKRRS